MVTYIKVGIMMKLQMISKEEKDTLQIAETLANYLEEGMVLTLSGDLGVGKTTFTKGIAKGLQIEARITSPTFTIVKEYEGRLPLYHMDVYRLEYAEEDLGFDEYFYGDGISVVEWAEFIEEFLPENYLAIQIERIDDRIRSITFTAEGKKYETLLEKLRNSTLGSYIK